MNCAEILYPSFVTWEVNIECNHNCIYCYNYKEIIDGEYICDEKRLDEISSFIIEHKPISVSISGGEPLLMYSELKKQIEKFMQHNIYVCVYTNGSVITDEMAKFFADYEIRLMVSFPSINREEFQSIVCNQYTYDSVIKGLDMLKKYHVNFQPNIVMTSINCDSIEATIAYLHNRYSTNTVFISRMTTPFSANKEYDNIKLDRKQMNGIFNTCVKLSKQYNIRMRSCGGFALCAFDVDESRKIFGKVCSFGVDGYTITNQGDIRGCSREDRVYGNIFVDEFERIRKAMDAWKKQSIPDECSKCKFCKSCRGGCHMAADKGCEPPVKIDCDADTSLVASFHNKGHHIRIINPFRKFVVSQISVLEDTSMYRISYLYGYLYVNKKVAIFLQKNKSFRFWKLYMICNMNFKVTYNLIDQMLHMSIIKKPSR